MARRLGVWRAVAVVLKAWEADGRFCRPLPVLYTRAEGWTWCRSQDWLAATEVSMLLREPRTRLLVAAGLRSCRRLASEVVFVGAMGDWRVGSKMQKLLPRMKKKER